MVLITIVIGAYKPTNITAGHHFVDFPSKVKKSGRGGRQRGRQRRSATRARCDLALTWWTWWIWWIWMVNFWNIS